MATKTRRPKIEAWVVLRDGHPVPPEPGSGGATVTFGPAPQRREIEGLEAGDIIVSLVPREKKKRCRA